MSRDRFRFGMTIMTMLALTAVLACLKLTGGISCGRFIVLSPVLVSAGIPLICLLTYTVMYGFCP